MKKINIAIVSAATVVIILIATIFITFLLISSGTEIREVERETREVSENFMFKEELWYYPLKGMVVKMENDTIPIGVAGQKYEINFGRIPEKSSTTKILNLGANDFARVELQTSGDISPYIEMPEKIYLRGENREIKILFNGTSVGNFTGTLLVRNIIPKNFLAEKIMELV